ncbi:transmembrane protein 242 [Hyposmocoma kahamanoa]|uniref:transmembrane protein 242 n=1 Tax=Hyposmocoma kahamanoa TaxID=1477025 RepID=UPI000E6D7C73|nr:transmembrane protein 242 [Hyposmocoma kahamanoa]
MTYNIVKYFPLGIKKMEKQDQEERLQRIKAGAFLASVAGISAFVGFGATLAAAKKSDPKYFNKGLQGSVEMADAGVLLALRALGWGTVYAVAGTSLICYGIWKLSGAKDLKDFRFRMGNILPALPKNNPPKSRTEFSGLNDLMTYLSEDYGKSKSVKEK